METQTTTNRLTMKRISKYYVVIYGEKHKATSREDALKKLSKYPNSEFHISYAVEEVWENGKLVDEIMVS